MGRSMTTEESVCAEVVRLHRFFEAWYDGEVGLTIEEFAGAMDPLFTIVDPDGRILGRDAIVATVRDGFGKGGAGITVEKFDVRIRDGYAVCRYSEVHASGSESTTRVSTAVMEPEDGSPGGFRWISVHETWTST
jgi:hypothetical protein